MTSPLYLLDTNITAYIASGRSQTARIRLKEALEVGTVMISTITQAEILFGLERKPDATRLRIAMEALLSTLQIKPWDSQGAIAYGKLRAGLNATGETLSLMDLLIASHAIAVKAILVTHGQAFQHLTPFLTIVDWATDL